MFGNFVTADFIPSLIKVPNGATRVKIFTVKSFFEHSLKF